MPQDIDAEAPPAPTLLDIAEEELNKALALVHAAKSANVVERLAVAQAAAAIHRERMMEAWAARFEPMIDAMLAQMDQAQEAAQTVTV